jgi:hypothetical protein
VVLVPEVMVLVVGMVSLQVVSLLEVLPLVLNTGMGGVVALRWRRRDGPLSSFRGFGPPLVREGRFPRSGYRGGVCLGSFGWKGVLDCAIPTFEQMARH